MLDFVNIFLNFLKYYIQIRIFKFKGYFLIIDLIKSGFATELLVQGHRSDGVENRFTKNTNEEEDELKESQRRQ